MTAPDAHEIQTDEWLLVLDIASRHLANMESELAERGVALSLLPVDRLSRFAHELASTCVPPRPPTTLDVGTDLWELVTGSKGAS